MDDLNKKVMWNDIDLANAFIDYGKAHGVTISNVTAEQLAQEIRSKSTKGDGLEIDSLIKEEVSKLFPDGDAVVQANSIDSVIDKALSKVASYKERMYKLVLGQEGPITPEEEKELKAGILNDVIVPMQDGVSDNVHRATRKLMRDLQPLQREFNEIEAYLNDKTLIDKLLEESKSDPMNRAKANAYKSEKRARTTKAVKEFEILKQLEKKKSALILLDITNNYVKRELAVIDQYRGVDGMSKYFENIFKGVVGNVREMMNKVRRGIVLPEVSEANRHNREWILRHHLTKTYQEGNLPNDMDSIDLDEFKSSPVYKEMSESGLSDETISRSLQNLNELPMTWRKGHAIYMLMDPPAEKTVHQDIPTLLESTPESWKEEIITNQPFSIEKGKFEEQKSKMERSTKPKAMTKERKMAEALNAKSHWSVLMNLARNQRVGKTGLTRAEQYLESLPTELRDKVNATETELNSIKSDKDDVGNEVKSAKDKKEEYMATVSDTIKDVLKTAEKMDNEDMLQDEDIISAALKNPSTPDWVLMKAAVVGYATKIRRIAKAILKHQRGWQPALDSDGDLIKDPTTNDFIWEKVPGFEPKKASLYSTAQSTDQYNAARQGFQDQINSVDQQLQTLQAQTERLRNQKTTLEKQRDSVKKPAPAPTTVTQPPAPVPVGPPPPAPGIASISSRGLEVFAENELREIFE